MLILVSFQPNGTLVPAPTSRVHHLKWWFARAGRGMFGVREGDWPTRFPVVASKTNIVVSSKLARRGTLSLTRSECKPTAIVGRKAMPLKGEKCQIDRAGLFLKNSRTSGSDQ